MKTKALFISLTLGLGLTLALVAMINLPPVSAAPVGTTDDVGGFVKYDLQTVR